METELITVQLPADVYRKLQALAIEQHTDPVSLMATLITDAAQQKNWITDLNRLRQKIQDDGGLKLGSKEEVIDRLRQTREEIFEAEYAHLYR